MEKKKQTGGDLTQDELNVYLTFPGEKIITAKRQHWSVLIGPILATVFIGLILTIFAYLSSFYFLKSLEFFISAILLVLCVSITVIKKFIIDSIFHLYIVTNRKILEVQCRPMFTDSINDVFLDQVRTTEVDAKKNGILNEILNVGDVAIAFDRPSHDKEFILENISNPRETGNLISSELKSMMHATPIWFQPRKEFQNSDEKLFYNHPLYDDFHQDEHLSDEEDHDDQVEDQGQHAYEV